MTVNPFFSKTTRCARSRRVLTAAAFLFLQLGGAAFADSPGTPQAAAPEAVREKAGNLISIGLGKDYSLQLFPAGDLFPAYAADPYRVGLGLEKTLYSKTDIVRAGSDRYLIRAGGLVGLFRVAPADDPGAGVQLSFGGGYRAQFDLIQDQDAIGWDGNYGAMLTAAPNSTLAFKSGVMHTSGHIGDEFTARTGRARLGYTRLEWFSGLRWAITRNFAAYTEYGQGFQLNNRTVQKPGRVQGGMEYEYPLFFHDRVGLYAAFDAQAMQERNWRADTTVQFGLVGHNANRAWHLGVEYHQGRPTISEFFQSTENYTSFGLLIDI